MKDIYIELKVKIDDKKSIWSKPLHFIKCFILDDNCQIDFKDGSYLIRNEIQLNDILDIDIYEI
jgi:hypothetical protein